MNGMPPKVVIGLTVAPPGGAATYAAGFLGGLARAALPAKDRIAVVVSTEWSAANGPLVQELRDAGVKVDPVEVPSPGTWRARLGRGRTMRRAMARNGGDVAFFPRDSAQRLKQPYVVLARNRYAWEVFPSSTAVGGRLSAWLLRRSARRSAERAAAVLAVSRVMADAVERSSRGALHVDEVVHHGCGIPAFERYPADGGPVADDRPPLVAMIGNIIANKGIETVIDAVARARADGRDWELRVFGRKHDRAYVAQLEAQAERSLGGQVLQGPAYGEALLDVYRMADVLVVGGTFESFCFPLIEGMRSGCVVVAPECALVRELCGDVAVTYTEGDVASLAGALATAWEERVQRSRAGVVRAAAFTWERTAESTIDLVREAAGGQARAGSPAGVS